MGGTGIAQIQIATWGDPSMRTEEVSFELLCSDTRYLCSFLIGQKTIQAVLVKCANVDRGCEWEGAFGTLEEHVATCEFALVPCPKRCKDLNENVNSFMKKNLDEHLENSCSNRPYKCDYCEETDTYFTITQVHAKTCDNKTIACPNTECDEHFALKDMKRHLDDCEFTELACKYQRLGCDMRMKRNAILAHEDENELHLHMALDTIVKRESSISTNILKNGASIFELADFHKKRESNEAITFPFYTSRRGYHMSLEVYPNGYGNQQGSYVSIYLHILEGKFDAMLKWPFEGVIGFTLLNQLEDSNHVNEELDKFSDSSMNKLVGSSWGYPTFIPHAKLGHDPHKNTQYLKDGSLYFKVSVTIPDQKLWLE